MREVISEALEIPDAKRHFVDAANGLDIDYAPESAHPLVGRFMPALGPDGTDAITAPLREGRGLLLDPVGATWIQAIAEGFTDRVRMVHGHAGSFAGLVSVLIRPDGYVAWASSQDAPADPAGLADALAHWFGPPTGVTTAGRPAAL